MPSQGCKLAAMLDLPRPALARVFWDCLVELAVSADDEDAEIGDRAEGLVRHARIGARV